MTKEIEYKDRESKLLEDEYRKYDSTVKNFEQKVKILEAGRDDALSKNQGLLDELQKLRKNFTDKEIDYENKLNILIMEKSTLQKNNSTVTSENKKLLADIAVKDSMINKTKNDMYEVNKSNDQLSSSLNEKVEEAKNNYYLERKLWEREKTDLKNSIEEYSRQCESLKLKIAKIESEDIKNKDALKKNFFKILDDSFKDKYKV